MVQQQQQQQQQQSISNQEKLLHDWEKIIPNAAYFIGTDKLLFNTCIAIVYEDPFTEKISTVFLARHGENQYNSLTIDARSRYFPACENLLPEYRKSNVRRSLAISSLRAYANLDVKLRNMLLDKAVASNMTDEEDLTKDIDDLNNFDWDETTAGDLASSMQLVIDKSPTETGKKILDLGFLQQKLCNAVMLDIVYEDQEEFIDENNKLVFLMGEQLDQLFDPLTEYSPESTEKVYATPIQNQQSNTEIDDTVSTLSDILRREKDSKLAQSIIDELITLQTNFTKNLVSFLQSFLVPLRIKVLNDEITGISISKLNVIFPPTIDEVTRVNCIFLDSLKNAHPYGSYEVLKACGTTIPYFYKAYMRHEAATKAFSSQLTFFFENLDINNDFVDSEFYSKRKIESLIHGSLNLIKLKLILARLLNEAESQWLTSEPQEEITKYYNSAISTIESFARDKLQPYDKRVFTPTGKILTELATSWPIELQYGWLTRRVVSIFGGVNLFATNENKNQDIIIIFSDHILFLTIDDPKYYKKAIQKNNLHIPSVPDILMHSLINQIPLKQIPQMRVNGWANIGDVYPSSYNNDKMIRFFVTGKGIKSPNTLNVTSVKQYEINDFGKLINGSKIIDLINKAKILSKSSPFHLFKTNNLGLSIYSTAHEKSVYREETAKSPFALFLNMTPNSQKKLYENNLFAALNARFIHKTPNTDKDFCNEANNSSYVNSTIEGEDLIEVTGISREGTNIHEIIPASEFSTYLAEELGNLYSNYLSFKNESMFDSIVKANDTLTAALKMYVKTDSDQPTTVSAQNIVELSVAELDEKEGRSKNDKDENPVFDDNDRDELDYDTEELNELDQMIYKDSKPEKRRSVISLFMSPLKRKLATASSEKSIASQRSSIRNGLYSNRTSMDSERSSTGSIFRVGSHNKKNSVGSFTSQNMQANKNGIKYDILQEVTETESKIEQNINNQDYNNKNRNIIVKSPDKNENSNKIAYADTNRNSETKKKSSFFDKLFRRKPKKKIQQPTANKVANTTSKIGNIEKSGNVSKTANSEESKPTILNSNPIESSSELLERHVPTKKITSSIPVKNVSATVSEPVANNDSVIKRLSLLADVNSEKDNPMYLQSNSKGTESISSFNTTRKRSRDQRAMENMDSPVPVTSIMAPDMNIQKPSELNMKAEDSFSDNWKIISDDEDTTIRPVVEKKKNNKASYKDSFAKRTISVDSKKMNEITNASLLFNDPSVKDIKRCGSMSSDNGKENYEYLDEIAKIKLAKENHEHLIKVKNHQNRKSFISSNSASSFGRNSDFNIFNKNGIYSESFGFADINNDDLSAKNSIHGSPIFNQDYYLLLLNDFVLHNSKSADMFSQIPATYGSRQSNRDSEFFDDYSDYEDDDLKQNWVIARENSSLMNLEKFNSGSNNNSISNVRIALNSSPMISNRNDSTFFSSRRLKRKNGENDVIGSTARGQKDLVNSESRNWTAMAGDTSSLDLSKSNMHKSSSGFSIYNDLIDDSISPNWIIARDNSTLLNIPKQISERKLVSLTKPSRSISRSKNVNFGSYQNKLRNSLNSLKNAESLTEEQKNYLLLNDESFDASDGDQNAEKVRSDGDHKYVLENSKPVYYIGSKLSDDEGRFHDEGDTDDFEESDADDIPQKRDVTEEFDYGDEYSEEEKEEEVEEEELEVGEDDVYESSLLRDRYNYGNKYSVNSGEEDKDFDDFEDSEEEDDDYGDDDESFDEPKQHEIMSSLPTMSSLDVGVQDNSRFQDDESDPEDAFLPFEDNNHIRKSGSGRIPRTMSYRSSNSIQHHLPLLKDIHEAIIDEDAYEA